MPISSSGKEPAMWTADCPEDKAPFSVLYGSLETRSNQREVDARYKWEWNNKCFENKSLSYLLLVVIAACSGSFAFGYILSVLNTSISVIGGQFLWCGYEGYIGCHQFGVYAGWVQNGMLIGGAVGCIVGGLLVNKVGCVAAFLFTNAVSALGVIMGIGANDFGLLMASRMVQGLAVGVVSVVVPTYIAEMTPPNHRGSYQVLQQVILQLGVFVGTLLGIPFTALPVAPDDAVQPTPEQMAWTIPEFDKIWWRVMQGFGLIPVVWGILSFGFLYQHETPYYLVRYGRSQEAAAVLQRTMRTDDVTEDLKAIERYTLKEREEVYSNRLAWRILFTSKHALHALAIGTFVSVFQQLGGIGAFYTSSNSLFVSAGVSTEVVTIITNTLTGASFLATIASIYLVEALGRRPLLVSGAFGMGVSVLPGAIMLLISENSTATVWAAVTGSLLFVLIFSLTWGPVVWVYIFEIFPTELKDQAGGVMTSANFIAGIVMIFAASLLDAKIVFMTFALLNVLAGVVSALCLRETRGIRVGDSPYFPEIAQKQEFTNVAVSSHDGSSRHSHAIRTGSSSNSSVVSSSKEQ
eukprot:Lankesteria_metandrocarpae@DN3499_c0_g1_i1.p1